MPNKKELNAHQSLLALGEENLKNNLKPRLLLHCCCAPCATACLEVLDGKFDVTLFFYNPNIATEEEYLKRLNELKNYVSRAFYGAFDVVEVGYGHGEYLRSTSGLEAEREGGARCRECFSLRLGKCLELAESGGYDYFATTLTVSPLKNAALINGIGETMSTKSRARYLPTDFKKQGGYLRSVQLSKQFGLYRQDYCGCEFSLKEAEGRRGESK